MQRRTFKAIAAVILVVGLLLLHELIMLVFTDRIAGLIVYGFWLTAVVAVSRLTSQLRLAQLRRLWGLAETLGYDEVELSRRAPEYTSAEWARSHPEQPRFFPRDRVVARLADELTIEYAERTGVC